MCSEAPTPGVTQQKVSAAQVIYGCPGQIRASPRLSSMGQMSVEQLRWRGYRNSRSDRKGPFWPVGQLPSTQAATLGQKLLSSF